ncbi:MAG: hypothetical protein DCF31_13665 [Alphaproteobacteria bacterium]|nr:MAG: hypothetical protein DCF31_13665 [Alphaproteobacteria bacterium]
MTTYCGPPPTPAAWLWQWNLDPVVIAGLVAVAGIGYPLLRDHPDRRRMLALALAVLAILFLSPLCGLTSALFSARSLHHVLLVAVAAPLLAQVVPRTGPTTPGPAFVVSTLVFWAWHVPALYAAALADTAIYWLMQASLLATATLFWRAVFAASPAQGVITAVVAAAQMGLLGALLALAPAPLYAPHLASTLAWGLGPLADQQLAGLLMWVPGMLPYAVVGAMLARRGWRLAAT